MKIRKTLTLTLLTLFGLFALSSGYAQELEQMAEPSFEKIYISPDRVLIYPEGIFYLNDLGDLTPARLVASDASGLYAIGVTYRCPGCHRRNRDNICTNNKCSLYGK